jgi:phosphohistidine phosphatase
VRRLILFRHAKAANRALGSVDAERPLEARGRRDAEVSGRWMAAAGLAPQLVLVSPSARTRETWDAVEACFPTARVEFLNELYDAAPADIEAAMAGPGRRAECVLVVGHNPGMQELAVNLLVEGMAACEEIEKVAGGFPTATVAVIDLADNGQTHLAALFSPRRDSPPPYVEAWDEEPGAKP